MNLFSYTLVFIVIFMCVYTLIDRVCRCFERCSAAKSYDRYLATLDKSKEGTDEN